MAIDKQNTHSGIFHHHPFGPLPAVPSSIPEVLPVGDALTTPNDPDIATVAGVFGPQGDSPQDAPPHPPFPLPAESPAAADFVYLCDLQPRPVEWLWQDRLACGTLAMISGVPGSGKTWIALAIAAALSRGQDPFTCEKLEPCTVLYASMEHNSSEIILPRFVGLHGDPKRFAVLRGARSATSASLNLRDTSVIEDALQRTHARLVILDSLDSYSGLDLHRPTETLPMLEKLARLAERQHCCILFIRHLSKSGPGRPPLRGHTEISATLRTEFLAGASPDAPSQLALLQIKSNLGPLAPALSYTIDDAGCFYWTGLSKLTREDMLADRPTGAGLPQRKFAGEWLREYLQNGSQTQGTIEIAAERDGVSIATLRRAKFDLGVHSAKDGIRGVWYWSLPATAGQQPPSRRQDAQIN
jgi:putative DNA primase/helicase